MTTTTRAISPDGSTPSVLPPLPRPCPPQAAQLHRLAALITEHDLPATSYLSVHSDSVHASMPDGPEGEAALHLWAQALDLFVRSQAHEDDRGFATHLLYAEGRIAGVHYGIYWSRPVEVAA